MTCVIAAGCSPIHQGTNQETRKLKEGQDVKHGRSEWDQGVIRKGNSILWAKVLGVQESGRGDSRHRITPTVPSNAGRGCGDNCCYFNVIKSKASFRIVLRNKKRF